VKDLLQRSLFEDKTFQLSELLRTVKLFMNRAASRSPYSREQIAENMNDIADKSAINIVGGNAKGLSLSTLDKWLNPSAHEYYPSILALTTFCQAIGDMSPLSPIINYLGGSFINEDDRRFLELGRAYAANKAARKKMRAAEEAI